MMKYTLSILLFFLVSVIDAQIVERPNPPRLYNNFSKEVPDFLNSSEAAQLEAKLDAFSRETSNQICVVIIDDLNGYEASEYAFKLGNEWGVGKADKDNGIVILIKPTTSDGGKKIFIATGTGLEGAIPDIATKKIRDEEITPYLKSGQYYEALDKGTDVLMQLAKGEVNVEDYAPRGKKGGGGMAVIIIIIAVILILRHLFGGGGRGGGRTFSRTGSAFLLGSMLGGMGRGGGSSSGGGGFGGFGGGSFGGGGSGGSW